MSSLSSTLPRLSTTVASLCFLGLLAFNPQPAIADDKQLDGASPPRSSDCGCPEASGKAQKPKFAGLSGARQPLDENDEIATLIGIQRALGTAADGTTYVWHRHNGRLSSIINPTSTFRNASGTLCRHIVVMLTTGHKTRKMEGTACRKKDGRWQFDG